MENTTPPSVPVGESLPMPDLVEKLISYVSLEDATREPGEGFWYVLTNRWWSYKPDKGLIFYGKSPQCNRLKNIADLVTKKCHPGADVIYVPRVYVKHDCKDYM